MKRLVVVVSVAVLLVTLSSGWLALAQFALIPHEDPALARSSPDLTVLLFYYGNAFNLAATGQHPEAQSLLMELGQARIPEELRYIINRYHVLSQKLLTALDHLELLLGEAAVLLDNNEIGAAREKLDSAEATAQDAQFLLDDLTAATDGLASSLKIWAEVATSPLRLTYSRLKGNLIRLKQLMEELIRHRQNLETKLHHKTTKLIATELSLSVTPTSVFIGDTIIASGRLAAGGQSLGNRKIALLFDDKPLVTVLSSDGSYTAVIAVPNKYVATMTLTAIYTPSGEDVETYLASQSPPVVINTRFYPTFLEVSAPETAHPGIPIALKGQVSMTDGNTARLVRIFLDSNEVVEDTVNGQFSFKITPPPYLATGKHNLTVTVAPQERYAGTSVRLNLDITRIPLQVDIQMPQLVVIPKQVWISGRISADLTPVPGARVSLALKQSLTTTKTAPDGRFAVAVDAPLDLSLVGPQKVTIAIAPVEPWYTPLEIKQWVFTVNPANLGLVLVAFLSLGLLMYQRVKIRPARVDERLIPQPPDQELPTIVPPPQPRYEFTGLKGRILAAYFSGLEVVERKTDLKMTAETTLGEFLKMVTPQLATALPPFTRLTLIAEVALYSARRLEEDVAAGAEQLAAVIKEELDHGFA